VGNDSQWQSFCQAAGHADWAGDERFRGNAGRVEHREIVVPLVEALMRTQTTAQWQELLESAGVPHAPVWNHADLFAAPQAAARGLRLTIKDPSGKVVDLVGSPFHISGLDAGQQESASATLPPRLGEHTEEVLREVLALDAEQIRELRERGVV